jgi:acyl-CoA synthetase (NDP forming)
MNATERIGKLLNPRAIAVVGASQAANKLAGQLIPALLDGGYTGRIYPVNPRYTEVAGQVCYPSVVAIPDAVDHCVIVVGKERVGAVLAECRAKGVPGASIYTSGYAEASSGGEDAQRALQEQAGDMTFIGPNCMGFSNLVDRVLAAPSAVLRRSPEAGDVALLSQSGGLAYATIAFFAQQNGMRFSHIVNTGNSAGVSYEDLVEYMFADAATKVLMVVAEGERAATEVIAAVRRLGLQKPIVLLKLGRGQTGARMALSHTGSLAGDFRLVRDIAEQHGIVCANDVDEALGVADLLRNGFTPAHGDGLASLCISGGNITLFADQVDGNGLGFAQLSEATEARLATVLPDYISVHNPIDITALGYEDPSLHNRVLDVLLTDPAVRTVVPILTTIDDYTEVCTLLADLKKSTGCAMAVLWSGGSYEAGSPDILRQAGVPIFRSASVLAQCLARLRRAAPARQAAATALVTLAPAAATPQALTEGEALAFLRRHDVPVPAFRACARADIPRVAREIGFPVAVKADSADTHISDSGGVILNLRSEADIAAAAPRIAALPGDEVIVAQFLPGHEIVAGTLVHPQLGLTLMLGSGGQLVELLDDVRFLALPATLPEIAGALASTTIGHALQTGFRGATGFDQAVSFLDRLSAAALASAGSVAQIECNPVTVGPHGAAAVDAAVYVMR